MERLYEHANDQHVANYIVYGKEADKKLYLEPEYKTQVGQAEATDAFKKGRLLIMDTTTSLVPVSMAGTTVKTVAVSGNPATVSVVDWAVAAAPSA